MQHFLILYYITRRKDCHAECRKTQENHRESVKTSAYAKYTEVLCFKVLVFGDLTVRRRNVVQNARCCGSGAVLHRTAVAVISARSAASAIIAVVAAVSAAVIAAATVIASENIYNYVLCTVCPVKQTKPVLGYDVPENTFHNRDIDWIVSAPQLGFLFPSFTDRSADIYSAMYYCRSASESYDEFIDAVFNREAPMPAEEQKTTFGTILGDALNDACSLDVVQTVHSRLCGMIEEHKASKDPEPLTITGRTMKTMLTACGVPGEKAEKFEEACAEQFGADAALSPRNLVETKKFEIKTPEVQIRVDPEYSEWIETRYIDGAPYILIPAGAGVQVNGVPIAITRPDVEYEEEE